MSSLIIYRYTHTYIVIIYDLLFYRFVVLSFLNSTNLTPNFYLFSDFKTCVIILLCFAVPVGVPDEMCSMLGRGQMTPGNTCLRHGRDRCPKPNEVTKEVVEGMTISLKTTRYHVNQELITLVSFLLLLGCIYNETL